MKKLLTILLFSMLLPSQSKAQGFLDFSISSSMHTPVGKYIYEGEPKSIPDSTICDVIFENASKNDPPKIIIKGIYVKKVGSSFLFTSTSKLSFLLDQNLMRARPILPKNFIPIDTTSIEKVTSEKQMFELWRTATFIDMKDLTNRVLGLPTDKKLNAIENIKEWPYSTVETTLVKLTTNKNLDVSKKAATSLAYWRKTYLPLLLKN